MSENLRTPSWIIDSAQMVRVASDFAREKHHGQFRKYTGEQYITHPWAVAAIVEKLGLEYDMARCTRNELVCAALLHDTVEDCDVSYNEIEEIAGPKVVEYVFWLTDVCTHGHGNRRIRKILEAERISRAPNLVHIVKLADILHNCQSIIKDDPNFAINYCKEKLAMIIAIDRTRMPDLDVVSHGMYTELYAMVFATITNFLQEN